MSAKSVFAVAQNTRFCDASHGLNPNESMSCLHYPNTVIQQIEYLAIDREADYKSEYVTGEIFAMGGASPKLDIAIAMVEIYAKLELIDDGQGY